MYLAPSRRLPIFLAFLCTIATVVLLYRFNRPRQNLIPFLSSATSTGSLDGTHEGDYRVRARVERLRLLCGTDDPFEREYGRANLRMSRGYEGSHHRLRQLLRKSLRGESLTIAAIGGSVTAGHHVYREEAWFYRFGDWLNDLVGEDVEVVRVNGAAPATGSDYFSFCFPLHIPANADLVLVELAVNDEAIPEHVENMENLLRGLLDMPNHPAVVLVEAMAFSTGGMGGGGGRMHLPVAQYFDVPVINHRHPLASHFARYPQLVRHYFAENFWGDPDTRHVNSRGHRDLAMLVASLVRDVTCGMLGEDVFSVEPPSQTLGLLPEPIGLAMKGYSLTEQVSLLDTRLADEQATWPEQSRSWRQSPPEGEDVGILMPGMFITPLEYSLLPRMRVLNGWNPDPTLIVPHFHPTCLSTRSHDPNFNLTPSSSLGWESWVHPEFLDKSYLVAHVPGATVSFEMETSLGVVKMYSLRSMTFGLGSVECWVDRERDRAVKVVGWWDKGEANIGRFATIRDDLHPGVHTITCEILNETSDPGGGHEFRMISMMSV